MKSLVLCGTALMTVLLVGGCASRGSVQRIEPGGPRAVTSMGVDIADFKNTAGKMVESMLAAGALNRITGRPAIILVSRIINDTDQQFDVDQIAFKITTDLNKSGKAQTLTTYGTNAVDPTAQEVARQRQKEGAPLPDFTLAGKILWTQAREGNLREKSYTFQLYLTDTETGLAVWQDEQIVSKQTSRSSVGF